MATRKAYGFVLVLELLLALFVVGFEVFFPTIKGGLTAFLLQSAFIGGLILANFLLFYGLMTEKRWTQTSLFLFFTFMVVAIFTITLTIVKNIGIVSGIISTGSVIILVVAIIVNATKEDEGKTKIIKQVLDKKSKAEIEKLKKETEVYEREFNQLKAEEQIIQTEIEQSKQESKAADAELENEIDVVKEELEEVKKGKQHFIASSGGTKFHRTTCPIAEKIPKEKAHWFHKAEEALEGGFTPCKTCSPTTKEDRFVANKNGNKFHRPTCMLVSKIPKEKVVWFDSEEKAMDKGFKTCKLCFPLEK